MQPTRTLRSFRAIAVVATLAVASAFAAGLATAQGKAPKGPVEVTVGSGPGGTPDVIMRNVVEDHGRGEDRHRSRWWCRTGPAAPRRTPTTTCSARRATRTCC